MYHLCLDILECTPSPVAGSLPSAVDWIRGFVNRLRTVVSVSLTVVLSVTPRSITKVYITPDITIINLFQFAAGR